VKCIKDDVERETAGARQRVEDAEAAIRQDQKDIVAAENTRLTTRDHEKPFHEMIVAVGHSLSNIASSDDGEDGEDEDGDEAEQCLFSKDEEPG